MKKLLFIILIACSTFIQAQTLTNTTTVSGTITTAQNALKTFEEGWVQLDYGSLKAEVKQSMIEQWYGLKIAVAKEMEQNKLLEQAASEAERQAQLERIAIERQVKISYLLSYGFKCDNSKEDWYKLYNVPKIFGSNWAAQADYQMSISTGVDYFLNIAYTLWQEIQRNN